MTGSGIIDPDILTRRFCLLRVWHANGQRAPHKALLALWAIGRCIRGEPRLVAYDVVDRELASLLRCFGPRRKTVHTEYPFWRMRNDQLWEIPNASSVSVTSKGDAKKRNLREQGIQGGFPESVYETLKADPGVAGRIAASLLEAHFPSSLHDGILQSVGIEPRREAVLRRRRDSGFRESVLRAYGYRCSVCAFSLRLHDAPVALDAAHIRWHSARGPDVVSNGLALCALHHRLFDQGLFTIHPGNRMAIANSVVGNGFSEALGKFDGKPLFPPRSSRDVPGQEFADWHRREVFGAC